MEYVIDIKSLSKSFNRREKGEGTYTSLKSAFFDLLLRREASTFRSIKKTHFAIKDLTIRVPKGASFGIIGRNGSGKSTLLKLITKIYSPSSGSVTVNGRISALIELGAGFHPDFTGRENVILGGLLYGLSRGEIEKRLPEITAFAELGEVIDAPVRTYSSGMFMRLGFSLAVHTDPDILLIDEVLAVGDASFGVKCRERLNSLKSQGKTFLLVTHDLNAVLRFCDEVLWIDNGEVKDRGEPRRVIDAYRLFVENGQELVPNDSTKAKIESSSQKSSRWGSREIEIISAEICGTKGEKQAIFHSGDSLRIVVRYQINDSICREKKIIFGIGINRSDGINVFGSNTLLDEVNNYTVKDFGEFTISFTKLSLTSGCYTIDLAAHDEDGYPYDYRKETLSFTIYDRKERIGVVIPEYQWHL